MQWLASTAYITNKAFEITANFNQSDETGSWKMERTRASIFAGGELCDQDFAIQNAGLYETSTFQVITHVENQRWAKVTSNEKQKKRKKKQARAHVIKTNPALYI